MKVIAFNGSARKDGNTANLINYVLGELIKEGIETELFQLAGKKIRGCAACYKCFENKDQRCSVKDDVLNECIEKMMEADGIILGSPTYFADLSAEMKALIESSQPQDGTERCWNWKADSLDISGSLERRGDMYNGYSVFPEYFGAYCMDGLAIALHSVYHTGSFDKAIEKCVNFLGDADSTAAVAGQLAGAVYGYSTINRKFIENLQRWDDGDVALRGVLLYELGSRSLQR